MGALQCLLRLQAALIGLEAIHRKEGEWGLLVQLMLQIAHLNSDHHHHQQYPPSHELYLLFVVCSMQPARVHSCWRVEMEQLWMHYLELDFVEVASLLMHSLDWNLVKAASTGQQLLVVLQW